MKPIKPAIAAMLVILTGSAFAHGRVQIGIGFGFPIYGGAYYGSPFHGPRYHGAPYYHPPLYTPYYPAVPVVISPPSVIITPPPVHVSQPAATVAPPPPTGVQPRDNSPYWYYCPDSRTYYPYVRGCASDWQQITPPPGD